MTKSLIRLPANITSVLALVWAGMLLGVSFLATPVKFLAPSLELPVALDVGRQTFSAFNKVELALVVLIVAAVIITAQRRLNLLLSGLLTALVIGQATWLLPVLDARVEVILTGGTLPSSNLHSLYVGVELLKLVALAALAYAAARARSSQQETDTFAAAAGL